MEKCPNTHFTLEIIGSIPPRVLNYLEPEYWTIYPETPAAEFARFLRLVKEGRPYTNSMLTADWGKMPAEYRAALAAQERLHLEQSVRYCRDELGIGGDKETKRQGDKERGTGEIG
jgi:hypothetical protein